MITFPTGGRVEAYLRFAKSCSGPISGLGAHYDEGLDFIANTAVENDVFEAGPRGIERRHPIRPMDGATRP